MQPVLMYSTSWSTFSNALENSIELIGDVFNLIMDNWVLTIIVVVPIIMFIIGAVISIFRG